MTDDYPRDLVGYGPDPPDADWPGGARIALQLVLPIAVEWLVLHYGEAAMRIWNENKLKASVIAVLILGVIYGLGRWAESSLLG